MVVKLVVLILASGAMMWLLRPSPKIPHAYSLPRFLAFESLLALVVLNGDQWFCDPLSARQIVSWVLLTASLILALHGFYLLRVVGNPKGAIENTTRVVKVGAYHYIRHPLYSSLLLLGWGVFLKKPSFVGAALSVVLTGFIVGTARAEEAINLKKFGPEYAAYVKTTRMFIPFLF